VASELAVVKVVALSVMVPSPPSVTDSLALLSDSLPTLVPTLELSWAWSVKEPNPELPDVSEREAEALLRVNQVLPVSKTSEEAESVIEVTELEVIVAALRLMVLEVSETVALLPDSVKVLPLTTELEEADRESVVRGSAVVKVVALSVMVPSPPSVTDSLALLSDSLPTLVPTLELPVP